jgi:hypothetical protein
VSGREKNKRIRVVIKSGAQHKATLKTQNKPVIFKISNTINHHVKARDRITDIYSLSGVYQMIRKDCPLRYIGQTGHTIKTRYKEHIREMKTNGQSSKFAQHTYYIQHTIMIPWIRP